MKLDNLVSAPSARPDPFPLRRAQVEVNGASFHVIEQGEGPAVLFAHGFPDTAETWRSQMRAVAEAGYRAVALDMRGFGASYAPSEAELYSALHIVGDLVGVLDALDIGSAVLVGHDWGADHAQRAMVMRPDRFHAVVSLSIPFAPRGEISTWDVLRQQGLGERYYAFAMMEPGADADFEPSARATARIPPYPRTRASAPVSSLCCRSSRCGSNRLILCVPLAAGLRDICHEQQ